MMYTVQIRGSEELTRGLDRLARQIEATVEDVLDESADRIATDLSSSAPRMTGALADSMTTTESSKGYRKIGPGGDSGSRGSPMPKSYAYWVEHGSSAHWPNINDIASRFGVDDGAAFLIARAISRRSMPPTNFTQDVSDRAEAIFYQSLNRLLTVQAF